MPYGVYPRTPVNTRHTRRAPQPIIIPIGPSIAYVPLTKGKFSLIERDDVNIVERYRWCAKQQRKETYAVSYVLSGFGMKHKQLHMHALLCCKDADHANHNTLDNRRRANLRKATRAQQAWNRRKVVTNTSGYKGVDRHGRMKNWQARITVNGKRIRLGYFATALEAADAYRVASIRFHGEFANSG